jgi:hypothetical protein
MNPNLFTQWTIFKYEPFLIMVFFTQWTIYDCETYCMVIVLKNMNHF